MIPGEEIEIDYSGDSIPFVSPATEKPIGTELFVASLPFSQKFYAEFSLSQRLQSCLMSTVNMFSFFGGVPKFLIVDNMKTAVNKYHKYDPFLNRSFLDMANHYKTGIAPARPYTPTDKPSVERAVGIIQQHFFPFGECQGLPFPCRTQPGHEHFFGKVQRPPLATQGKIPGGCFQRGREVGPRPPSRIEV